MDIDRIEKGTYEPPKVQQSLALDGPSDRGQGVDLAELIAHGCPRGVLNVLRSSQLAEQRPLKSIGDLLAAISQDASWSDKVKGLGEASRDKLINALTEWGTSQA